ncbi:MAG TPA: hypothetical protein VFL42_09160, partial [Terriglobales bacterium]|nr:hypothetical protein [Terriglobales bacterium]
MSSHLLNHKLSAHFATFQMNQPRIVASPLIEQLAEYNVPGQAIGHGSFIGTNVISANAPGGSITDSAIRAQLKKWIQAKAVPGPTDNTLYFIYL